MNNIDEGHAYRSVEKGAQAQAAGEWVEREECRNCEHDQIKEETEISYRHAVDATVRTLEDNVASVDGRGTPEQPAGIDRVGIVKGYGYSHEREHEHEVRGGDGALHSHSYPSFAGSYVIRNTPDLLNQLIFTHDASEKIM